MLWKTQVRRIEYELQEDPSRLRRLSLSYSSEKFQKCFGAEWSYTQALMAENLRKMAKKPGSTKDFEFFFQTFFLYLTNEF